VVDNRQGPFLGIIILIVTGGAENFCIAPEGDGVCEEAGLGIVEAGRKSMKTNGEPIDPKDFY
jgi:hypothetical protein